MIRQLKIPGARGSRKIPGRKFERTARETRNKSLDILHVYEYGKGLRHQVTR